MLYESLRDPYDAWAEKYFGTPFIRPPTRCIVDVGAYKASWAIATAALLKPEVIYLFEPDPDQYKTLLQDRRNYQDKAEWRICNCAVGNQRGKVPFHRYPDMPLFNSSLPYQGPLERAEDFLSQTKEVEQVRLDDILVRDNVIDYLKIDVQGSEISVLQGAKETLRKTKLLLIECNFLQNYVNGSTIGEVHNFLSEQGFLLVELDAPSRYRGICAWTDALYVNREVWLYHAFEINPVRTPKFPL